MDIAQLVDQLGPWVGVVASLGLTLRSYHAARLAEAEAGKLRASADVAAVTQLRTWIEEMRVTVRSQASRIRSLERDYAEISHKCAELENENSSLRTQVRDLQKRVGDAESQRDALRDERDELANAIATHRSFSPPPGCPVVMPPVIEINRKKE
jgi:septal ring factor EnvC (AmiA/AmiB activator)